MSTVVKTTRVDYSNLARKIELIGRSNVIDVLVCQIENLNAPYIIVYEYDEPSAVVEVASDNDDLLGASISELHTDVVVGEDAITGQLNYKEEYTGFSDEEKYQNGYFLALKITTDADRATAKIIGGEKPEFKIYDKEDSSSYDGVVVLFIKNNEQKVRINFYDDEKEEVISKTYSLKQLVLEPVEEPEEPDEPDIPDEPDTPDEPDAPTGWSFPSADDARWVDIASGDEYPQSDDGFAIHYGSGLKYILADNPQTGEPKLFVYNPKETSQNLYIGFGKGTTKYALSSYDAVMTIKTNAALDTSYVYMGVYYAGMTQIWPTINDNTETDIGVTEYHPSANSTNAFCFQFTLPAGATIAVTEYAIENVTSSDINELL